MAGNASITAPEGLHFGETFMPTFTAPTGYKQRGNTYLYASMDIWQDGVYVNGGNFVNLDGLIRGNAGPFVLSGGQWAGGAANGKLTMYTIDFSNGRTHAYATDDFTVAA